MLKHIASWIIVGYKKLLPVKQSLMLIKRLPLRRTRQNERLQPAAGITPLDLRAN